MNNEMTIDEKIDQALIGYDELITAYNDTGDVDFFKMATREMAKIEKLYREKTRIH